MEAGEQVWEDGGWEERRREREGFCSASPCCLSSCCPEKEGGSALEALV